MKNQVINGVYFCFTNSSKIEINDGSIKVIWLEHSKEIKINEKHNDLQLAYGENALIEFTNGKKMIITNSEWCSLNWLR